MFRGLKLFDHSFAVIFFIHTFCWHYTLYTEVVIWFDSRCGCSYSSNEGNGPQVQVCAEIQFINGTELTTSNYTVTISPVDDSAQSKLVIIS